MNSPLKILFPNNARRSLFRRLLGGFSTVMLAIWVCVLAFTIYEIKKVERQFAQLQLQSTALQTMAALRPVIGKPEQMRDLADELEQSHRDLYGHMNMLLAPTQIQVWHAAEIIYSSSGIPIAQPSSSSVGKLSTLRVGGDDWLAWSEVDLRSGVTVRAVQESLAGFAMSWTSLGFYLLPLLVSFPFLLFPAWLIIRHGLRPLTTIVTQIEERSAADLSALPSSDYEELSPVVRAVNRLMSRLNDRLVREQEFLHDAAHELKTPLAVIQISAGSMRDAQDSRRIAEASSGLDQGVARATHVVHQLLALARSGADVDLTVFSEVDLTELLRERLALVMQMGLPRGIEFGLHAPDHCPLPLHRESVTALIDNILDNALKYSPDHGHVEVNLVRAASKIQLLISDEGPGIAPALRDKVFERFYRVPGSDQIGSGLGLAIAQQAAGRNNARISLHDAGPGGSGLLVIVELTI